MKKQGVFTVLFLMVCLVFASTICMPDTVSAKEITTLGQAKKLAKKKVKGASVVKLEKDRENGTIVYEIELSKGKKEYNLVYRAKDSKLLSYEWEIKSIYIKRDNGNPISTSECKTLAKKQVPGASITSIVNEYDDGISMYKVKMKKSNKKYELIFHAANGKLLEYEWELTAKSKNSKSTSYIGETKAKQIALAKAGGGTVTKIKLDNDDGVWVYEVDIIKGDMEYEIKVHAKTGKILEVDMESIYD